VGAARGEHRSPRGPPSGSSARRSSTARATTAAGSNPACSGHASLRSRAAEAPVRPRGFQSMKPTVGAFSSTAPGAGAYSTLRLSVVLALPVPSSARGRRQTPLSRPARALPAWRAPALPVSDASLRPSPGAAARAGRIPRASQGAMRASTPRFTRAAPYPQCKRASSKGAPELPSPLTLPLV
jgi:hypothetical protein